MRPGDAVSTPGFALKLAPSSTRSAGLARRRVGRGRDARQLLRSSLGVADALKAKSVAFPAISTASTVPRELAARIAVDTIKATKTKVARVILVAFDEETAGEYRGLLGP